jgi:chitosanase
VLTDTQKRTAQAIVNIFETGLSYGDYGAVTLMAGDSGHLTYGRSQTTLASGNLYLLIKDYCEHEGAVYADSLKDYLDRLAGRDLTLDHDLEFREILREAGDDSIMREVQDQFFDRVYWQPSVQAAENMHVVYALGTTVIYDSHIHGSWRLIRNRTVDKFGSVEGVGEKGWLAHYVEERRNWLANHTNSLLHRTVYRMDSFQQLIADERWELSLPFRIRGIWLDEETVAGPTPERISAHDESERLLRLETPFMSGEDVKDVQEALKREGFTVAADGIFGPKTERAVKRFQDSRNLKVDGIVGPSTRAALGIER